MFDVRPPSTSQRIPRRQPFHSTEITMRRTNVLRAATVNYLELIGNGKAYRVPLYQRDYAWTEEEWEDLWNDVLDLRRQPEGRHYMGALVVQGRSDREFTIIDGQQRLATIGILSLAVIGKLHRMADQDIDAERNRERAKELRNRFVGEKDPASLIESSRLNLSKTDDAFYQDYLVQLRAPINPRGLPQSNALLWKCFRYFSAQLDALDDIQEDGEALARILSETAARCLLFILITVEDELDAYTVFETLNARGLELTTADLLKNYLFSKVRVQSDLDALQRRWQALIAHRHRHSRTLLGLPAPSPPLRAGQNSQGTTVQADTRSCRHTATGLRSSECSGRAVRNCSPRLPTPTTSTGWNNQRRRSVHSRPDSVPRTAGDAGAVRRLGATFSSDDFVRVLKLVSVVSFRYLVSGRNTNTLEPVYHEAAKAILDGNATRPRVVFTRLRPVYVDDGAFESNFAVFSINARGRKKLLKYILCRLEEDAGGIARDPEADPASIEHILPQNPSGDWTEAFSALELEAAVDRIGNATLLESAVNRNIGGAPYSDKRPAYEQSAYALTRQVAEMAPEEWTFVLMERRQQHLAQRAVQVWRSDFA